MEEIFSVETHKLFTENPQRCESFDGYRVDGSKPSRLNVSVGVYPGTLGPEGSMGFAGYYGDLLEWDAYLHFMFIPMGENKRHQLLIFFDNSSNLYKCGEIAKRIAFNDLSEEQYRSLTVDHESDFDAAWEILWGVFKDELGAKKSPDH